MTLLRPGLVSVTFRKLTPQEIISLMVQTQLECIEWGSDVHVPHGELTTAKTVAKMTADSGIKTVSYGSYYRDLDGDPSAFDAILDTATALDTSVVRIWAGRAGSAIVTHDERKRMVEHIQTIARSAQKRGMILAFEYHGNSLTDTPDSTEQLLAEVNCSNVLCHWQVPLGQSDPFVHDSLKSLTGSLCHVHVFHWEAGADGILVRRALHNGTDRWKKLLAILKDQKKPRVLLLEFVANDSVEQFIEDATTLRQWITHA